MVTIKYYRESCCAADDYVNCDQTITMPDNATLSDLVHYILHTHFGNYSFIPYTGGGSLWVLTSNAGNLATVSDDQERIIYINFAPTTLLKDIGVKEIYAKR